MEVICILVHRSLTIDLTVDYIRARQTPDINTRLALAPKSSQNIAQMLTLCVWLRIRIDTNN